MKTEKEILEALYVLQDTCNDNSHQCGECMLRNGYGTCGVIYDSNGESFISLTEWQLKDYENPRLILS